MPIGTDGTTWHTLAMFVLVVSVDAMAVSGRARNHQHAVLTLHKRCAGIPNDIYYVIWHTPAIGSTLKTSTDAVAVPGHARNRRHAVLSRIIVMDMLWQANGATSAAAGPMTPDSQARGALFGLYT